MKAFPKGLPNDSLRVGWWRLPALKRRTIIGFYSGQRLMLSNLSPRPLKDLFCRSFLTSECLCVRDALTLPSQHVTASASPPSGRRRAILVEAFRPWTLGIWHIKPSCASPLRHQQPIYTISWCCIFSWPWTNRDPNGFTENLRLCCSISAGSLPIKVCWSRRMYNYS